MTLNLLESAQEDLLVGYLFYEEQQLGLGDYFVNTLMAEIDALSRIAGSHPIRRGYHRMLSDRFPFAVYYKTDGNEVHIRAVLDCRQDPQSIANRLK